ncbi:hypothetical protein ABEB36_002850 [Hypothenemus hampei]|uniref:Uncharacterized protein n=1 Tax=Hypothenemus hampei TaxID=57062 RepID=A0ABD1F922_HYPHA
MEMDTEIKKFITTTNNFSKSSSHKWITQQIESCLKNIGTPSEESLEQEKTPSKFEIDTKEILKKRCERIVSRHKYERNSPEIRQWWLKMFETLESDATIPPEQQLPLLEESFSKVTLNKVLRVCSTRSRQFKEELDSLSEDDITRMFRSVQVKTMKIENSSKSVIYKSNVSLIDREELENIKNALDPSEMRNIEHVFRVTDQDLKSKMYIDFFQRNPTRAAVWRPLPPLSPDEMNLSQKAEAISEKIAKDFINWLKGLYGDEQFSLSVESVIQMFEIKFHADSATSLKVYIRELPAVPRRVAEKQHLLSKAKRSVLRHEIAKDVKAGQKKTAYTGFGTHLPPEMQVRPPAENYYRKWISCDRVPEKLVTMAKVWEGITHLKSTRAFCKFLIDRPEISPPKYLHDCGMLNLKHLMETDGKLDNKS